MNDATQQQLVDLTQQLLDSIAGGDWETYARLCDPSLSAFEPEARGQRVDGMPFHKFFFDLGRRQTPHNTTLCSPHVRLLGDQAAIVSYVRLIQTVDGDGVSQVQRYEETRVW